MIGKIIIAIAVSAVAVNGCSCTGSLYGLSGSYNGLGSPYGFPGYPDAAVALASYSAAVPPCFSSLALPALNPLFPVFSCLSPSIGAPLFPAAPFAAPLAYPAAAPCGLIC